ncbi:sensor histidine kinase [Pseudofrankia asymbiotica]|nr:histidine kinase [Pseudofrankia asymbiotica]
MTTTDPPGLRRRAAGVRWRWPGLGPWRGAGGLPARLSPWAWMADGILAFVLVAATLVAARNGGSLVVPRLPSAQSAAAVARADGLVPPARPDRPAPPDPVRSGGQVTARPGAAADPTGPAYAPTGPAYAPVGPAYAPAGPTDVPAGPTDLPDDPADAPDAADGDPFQRPWLFDLQPEAVPYWQLIAAVLVALPLVARRWRPLAAYWAVLAATVAFHRGVTVEDAIPFTFVALLVAAYSAAVYSPHRALAVASVLVGAAQVVAFPKDNIPDFRPVYLPFIVLVLIGLAANAIHLRQQRASVVAAEQEAASRRAVEQERARIARELHDVVTHSVSVMIIQAGAARKVLDAAPDQAREAMLAVESSGRAAMTELRHVMGLLTMADAETPATAGPSLPGGGEDGEDRDGNGSEAAGVAATPAGAGRAAADGAAGGSGWHAPVGAAADGTTGPTDDDLAPQPGLGQLATLVGRVRAAGVNVELVTTGTPVEAGTPVELPPGVDLAAFRVVQEALTNAVRHASGARVRIVVDRRPAELRLEVTDNGGRPTAVAGSGGGAGLVGLRERLAVYGGSLWAGRLPLGGFGVRAQIPLEAGPAGPLDAAPGSLKSTSS